MCCFKLNVIPHYNSMEEWEWGWLVASPHYVVKPQCSRRIKAAHSVLIGRRHFSLGCTSQWICEDEEPNRAQLQLEDSSDKHTAEFSCLFLSAFWLQRLNNKSFVWVLEGGGWTPTTILLKCYRQYVELQPLCSSPKSQLGETQIPSETCCLYLNISTGAVLHPRRPLLMAVDVASLILLLCKPFSILWWKPITFCCDYINVWFLYINLSPFLFLHSIKWRCSAWIKEI